MMGVVIQKYGDKGNFVSCTFLDHIAEIPGIIEHRKGCSKGRCHLGIMVVVV